jgi:adenosylcobinamide-GDP ribazoletransferase
VPRSHPLRDAGLAISLMSIIPTRSRWPEGEKTQVAAWFPAVGALYGVVGYAMVKLADLAGADRRAPLVVGALVLGVWALLGRFLHWDGLADVADGFWGSHEPARRLEIMSDSATGAFGATAVTLVALLEVAALGAVIGRPHELPILVVPIVARFSATAAAWLGTPARSGGLGRSVMGHPTTFALLIALVPLAGSLCGLWLGFKMTGVALGALGIFVAFSVPHVLAGRFGGVTGDVMGASVLITEAILFASFALVV